MNEAERTAFHPDFERAFCFATRLHARQVRKGADIPYISHLLGVASLVLEYGGGREEAIAGLLHDSLEDCAADYPGGAPALRTDIEAQFGHPVLAIVEGCTDADTVPKPPWKDRKERYVAHVREAPASVRLVSCADKLHNTRAIVADLRRVGPTVFERFKGGRDGTLWYYQALTDVFLDLGPFELAAELGRTVNTMNQLVRDTGEIKKPELKQDAKQEEVKSSETPEFALFQKGVTGKEILDRLGIVPKK